MKISTNNNNRNFLDFNEVPEKVLKNEFDWCENLENETFLKYKNNYYCLSEFVRVESLDLKKDEWHGIHTDSAFSAVVISLVADSDTYKIGYLIA